MSNGNDAEWKFWLLIFIVSIAILAIALLCKIFIVVGAVLAIGGIIVAVYGYFENEEEALKTGVIAEFVGLFLLILGTTVYNFLVEKGLIAFAQEILKIIPFVG
jgi:hypothetical protein